MEMHIFAKQNEQTRKNISWHEWWNRQHHCGFDVKRSRL